MSAIEDEVDNAISEYGWAAVQDGLHQIGREPTVEELRASREKRGLPFDEEYHRRLRCKHHWAEDETGAEPPYDTCVHCGQRRY